MSKEKKESIFKRIFSSNQDCCSVDIEEIEENNDEKANAKTKGESSCCSNKTE
ncbi:alcohol dehydrogenase [Cerasibacillus terrae]|uniref:Alcohol dehydrogenase n=1 Tax=Cerasibacillus terrae TaxID=2498845 RepID=A0A5C8NV67_9BACI|nr:alcohol dehydrogenase [Cerasibacillus terrae]TXL65088.1 alcohol dehydrogenase [Cerasibacillus terrae]